MANTVIALRSSGVASNTPSLGVLANGELSINFADGIIYYKSSSNTLGSIRTTAVSGLTTEVQFNDAGVFGANANFTFNKTLATLNVKNINVSTNLVTVNLTATSITTGTGAGGIIAGANVIYSNIFVANSTTTSTSNTTGAIISNGGLGVKGNVYADAIYDGGIEVISFANQAFTQANSANVLAQAAYNQANTDYTTISTTAGVYGNASHVTVTTLTANGRVSAITNTAIAITSTSVTGVMTFAQGGANATTYTTGGLLTSNGTAFVSVANTGTAGTYGNASYVPIITTDAYGRVTSVSNVAIVASGIANTTVTDDTFTGTGSTTIYTMASAATQNTVLVAINGILQPNTAYTIVNSNTTITMTEAPGLNDTVNIKRITGSGTSGGGGSSTTLTTSNTTLTATSNGTTLVVGNFASTNDAIQKQYLVRNTTTNATESELMIDATNRISVNTNTTVFFTADIVARRTDAINESASFFLKGAADNFSGTVAAVGSLYEVIVARDDASYLVDVRANNTTKTLNIYVTGVAGKTIRWVGNINTVEVAQ